jgi:hypothetical protein
VGREHAVGFVAGGAEGAGLVGGGVAGLHRPLLADDGVILLLQPGEAR